MTPLLEAEGLRVHYGGVHALDGVDLEVFPGEIVGLVGGNGAGKTTLLACLSGHIRPTAGRVHFDAADVTTVGADARARLGIVRSFQDAKLFPTMPVWDVLLLAQDRTSRSQVLISLSGLPPWRAAEERRGAEATRIAGAMGLTPHLDKVTGELSTGLRRVLDLACAVALRPRLLLLDEPSAGLAAAEAATLPAMLRQVRDATEASIVMVEHDLPLVWSLAGRIVVIEEGRVAASGAPAEVRRHPAVAFGEFG